jgi:hypothetical protein
MRSKTIWTLPPTGMQAVVTLTLSLALSMVLLGGCAEVVGSKTIDTEPAAESEGEGPGLFSGKEGGIVFYNDVWWGSAPGGDVSE